MNRQNEIKVKHRIQLLINGHSAELSGESIGCFGVGDIKAKVSALNSVPEGFDLGLLVYVLLTGQPSMSYCLKGAFNPFHKSYGTYEACRTLDLGEFGNLKTDYKISKSGKNLFANFKITGTTSIPSKLIGVAPSYESWMPIIGSNEILGHFTMIWNTKNGQYIKGEADTRYLLPHAHELDSVQHREIKIDFQSDNQTLIQNERIVLFKNGFVNLKESEIIESYEKTPHNNLTVAQAHERP
ncbi:hypothetical protein CLV90_3206 [Maribacter spongiicola]|uniref:Uncharacterized protein n=1 Tax=Maribacter spongiicola TaxID=1206753 RepID=A0A4R7JUD5_9FLAO|nr:hypothetical protein [Maribacter spongiicola]TDT41972.1 hypothetical protein CLV90_3206 [Maribacter spongiicola]